MTSPVKGNLLQARNKASTDTHMAADLPEQISSQQTPVSSDVKNAEKPAEEIATKAQSEAHSEATSDRTVAFGHPEVQSKPTSVSLFDEPSDKPVIGSLFRGPKVTSSSPPLFSKAQSCSFEAPVPGSLFGGSVSTQLPCFGTSGTSSFTAPVSASSFSSSASSQLPGFGTSGSSCPEVSVSFLAHMALRAPHDEPMRKFSDFVVELQDLGSFESLQDVVGQQIKDSTVYLSHLTPDQIAKISFCLVFADGELSRPLNAKTYQKSLRYLKEGGAVKLSAVFGCRVFSHESSIESGTSFRNATGDEVCAVSGRTGGLFSGSDNQVVAKTRSTATRTNANSAPSAPEPWIDVGEPSVRERKQTDAPTLIGKAGMAEPTSPKKSCFDNSKPSTSKPRFTEPTSSTGNSCIGEPKSCVPTCFDDNDSVQIASLKQRWQKVKEDASRLIKATQHIYTSADHTRRIKNFLEAYRAGAEEVAVRLADLRYGGFRSTITKKALGKMILALEKDVFVLLHVVEFSLPEIDSDHDDGLVGLAVLRPKPSSVSITVTCNPNMNANVR